MPAVSPSLVISNVDLEGSPLHCILSSSIESHPQYSPLHSWQITSMNIILDFFCTHLVTDCAFWWWLRSITALVALPLSRPRSSLLWTTELPVLSLSPTLGYNVSFTSCHPRAKSSSFGGILPLLPSFLVKPSVDPDHTGFCLFDWFSCS